MSNMKKSNMHTIDIVKKMSNMKKSNMHTIVCIFDFFIFDIFLTT